MWRKKERGPGNGNNKERATLWEQKREGHVVEQLRKGQVVGTIKGGPGCGNKRERARLCEQKREGQVVGIKEREGHAVRTKEK